MAVPSLIDMAIELYLSVVVPVPDDSDIQAAVAQFREYCRRQRIPSEVILLTRTPRLAETLKLPALPGPCAVRIIEAPTIADNVGIRRARGRFVFATNLDDLLSRDLLQFIAAHYRRYGTLRLRDIATPDGSLVLGSGWFPRERAGAKPFRWFRNDAEIRVYADSDSQRVLAMDIEPRPGRRANPPVLQVVDDQESTIVSAELARRRVVNIPLPALGGKPTRLRVRVSDDGRRWSIDRRPFQARVFRFGLYETPMAALPWSLPERVWWALTRGVGTSLLPQLELKERWPDESHLKTCGDVILLAREHWFELRGYPEPDGEVDAIRSASAMHRLGTSAVLNGEGWGLGTERLKETLVIESVHPDWRTPGQVLVDFAGLPFVLFFRSIPLPPLPEPGAFVHSPAAEEPPPLLKNPPKISIVTPSYQQGPYLEWTIRSVLEQEYPNLEYVVMDGGSKDQTKEILERYKDRLAYCESAQDKGQADAVARGFAHTSGEIMAYLNSDDLLAPGALHFAARYFEEHPEVDAIYSHRVFIDENNIVTRYWILPPHHSWMMMRWDYIPQETCFWRRRIYEKVGGIDPSFEFALDYDLFVRFMQQGRMERVNRFLGAFREHVTSKTVLQEGAHPEVDRIQAERGIHMADWQRIPQLLQHELLEVRSTRFAARGKILPGNLAGIGYDYDLVWRGRLNGQRNSSRSSSDTRPI
jgi:glycosyltransferase involved in cell wall biosynthesis